MNVDAYAHLLSLTVHTGTLLDVKHLHSAWVAGDSFRGGWISNSSFVWACI